MSKSQAKQIPQSHPNRATRHASRYFEWVGLGITGHRWVTVALRRRWSLWDCGTLVSQMRRGVVTTRRVLERAWRSVEMGCGRYDDSSFGRYRKWSATERKKDSIEGILNEIPINNVQTIRKLSRISLNHLQPPRDAESLFLYLLVSQQERGSGAP